MGEPGASEGMSGAFDRGGAEECQGKIVEFVQDDCGTSSGARNPAKVSSPSFISWNNLFFRPWMGGYEFLKPFATEVRARASVSKARIPPMTPPTPTVEMSQF